MKIGLVIEATGAECWRDHHAQLVPGGHLAVLTTIRRYHRVALAIEDAGFEVRDQIKWMTRHGEFPICLARKPLKGTVAQNVLKHGAGALNINGCRIGTSGGTTRSHHVPGNPNGYWRTGHSVVELAAGRWPANLITDGSPEVVALFPHSTSRSGGMTGRSGDGAVNYRMGTQSRTGHDDEGSAARYFATAPDKPALFAYLNRLLGVDAGPAHHAPER